MTTRGGRVLLIRVFNLGFVDVLRVQGRTLDIDDLLRGIDWKGRKPLVIPILLQVEENRIYQCSVNREIKTKKQDGGRLTAGAWLLAVNGNSPSSIETSCTLV